MQALTEPAIPPHGAFGRRCFVRCVRQGWHDPAIDILRTALSHEPRTRRPRTQPNPGHRHPTTRPQPQPGRSGPAPRPGACACQPARAQGRTGAAPAAGHAGAAVPGGVRREAAAAQAWHLRGPDRGAARGAASRRPEGRAGAAHALDALPQRHGRRPGPSHPRRRTGRTTHTRAGAPRADRGVPPPPAPHARRPAARVAPAHPEGLRGLGTGARDEAQLRAFEASGKTVEAFAEMYGLLPAEAQATLDRARSRQKPAVAP